MNKIKMQKFLSKDSGKEYEIRTDGRKFTCNCPAWVFARSINIRKEGCKHIKAYIEANKEKDQLRSQVFKKLPEKEKEILKKVINNPKLLKAISELKKLV